MANFSAKERFIASLLSATPGLKSLVKDVYVRVNALLYKKSYTSRLFDERLSAINIVLPSEENGETFFGYYDKSPINKDGWVLFHEAAVPTSLIPNPDKPIRIALFHSETGMRRSIGLSSSYTWQQGARAQWLSEDELLYNDFRKGRYVAVLYSLKAEKELLVFDYPVQDSFGRDYFLSIDYRRIMYLRPDYGYRNLPLPSMDEMNDLEHDGIWRVDYADGRRCLIHSLKEIITCEPKAIFSSCLHKVNHVMIRPDGKGFIFIHRFYQGKRRFDRLMYSDFHSLKVLADDGMVSHCCWIDEKTVFGYLRFEGRDGFYRYSLDTGEMKYCPEPSEYNMGDGHPSCWKDWIVFDSYPDKSRMQHLTLYNWRTNEIVPLLEVWQNVCYKGQTRCDLHPRFSADGRKVFFDSVYSGKRRLCFVDVSNIVK